jgi:DNA-binding NarL/FixJ family response regulator
MPHRLCKLRQWARTREFDIVKLVTHGASNKQIARILSVTEGTVKTHLHAIYQKMAVGNRTMLEMAQLQDVI